MGLFDFVGSLFGGDDESDGLGGLLGGKSGYLGMLFGGLSQYSNQKSKKEDVQKQADLALRNAQEMTELNRKYVLDDRAYRQQGLSNFNPYFNPQFAGPTYDDQGY